MMKGRSKTTAAQDDDDDDDDDGFDGWSFREFIGWIQGRADPPPLSLSLSGMIAVVEKVQLRRKEAQAGSGGGGMFKLTK